MSSNRHEAHHNELISSPSNPTIRFARSLHRKKVRQRERAMLVEGIRSVRTAVEHGASIRTLLIDAARIDDVDPDLLATLRGAAHRTLRIDHGLFLQVAETEHPQPLIAVCDVPDRGPPQDCTFVVVLDAVRDPGNLGTLVRSCAAAGADAVALLPGTVDPYNPKAIRASTGAMFAIPVGYVDGMDAIVTNWFEQRPTVVVSDAEADRAYDQVDWRAPVILVIGGEAEGVTGKARSYADFFVHIPMTSGVESLNAAVAGSVLAFEVARQRRVVG